MYDTWYFFNRSLYYFYRMTTLTFCFPNSNSRKEDFLLIYLGIYQRRGINRAEILLDLIGLLYSVLAATHSAIIRPQQAFEDTVYRIIDFK